MAAGGNAIKQRIGLEGADQIRRELNALGSDGARAFAQLKGAIENVNAPFLKLGVEIAAFRTALGNIGSSVSQLGSSITSLGLGFGALIGAVGISGAAGALLQFAKSAANAGEEANKQSQILGTTVSQYKQLSALAKLADVSGSELTKAFNKLNAAIAGNSLTLKQAEPQLGQFFSTFEGGVKRTTLVTEQNIGQLQKIAEGTTKELLPKVGEFFTIFTNGVKRQVLITEDNVKGLTKTVLQERAILSGKELTPSQLIQSLGIPTTDALTGALRPSFEILKDLAGAFEKMPDGAKKAAIAMQLFGERIGTQLIPLLNQGKKGIEEIANTLKDFGIGVDPVVEKLKAQLGEKFNDTIKLIEIGLGSLKGAFGGTVILETLKPLEDFLQALRENHAELREIFKATGETVGKFVADVIRLLTPLRTADGQIKFVDPANATEQQQAIIAIRDTILSVGTIGKLAFDAIALAISGLVSVAGAAASVINLIFGSNITGGGLLLALTIARVTGLLGVFVGVVRLATSLIFAIPAGFALASAAIATLSTALTGGAGAWVVFSSAATGFFLSLQAAAIPAIRAIMVALAPLIGWPLLLLLGVFLVVTYWQDIKAVTLAAVEQLKGFVRAGVEGIQKAWAGLAQFFNDGWAAIAQFASSVWQGIVATVSSAFDSIVNVAGAAWEKIKGFFQRMIDKAKEFLGLTKKSAGVAGDGAGAAAGGGDAGGFARGGVVRGRGSSTSDSIPAWLSSGEFVIRADAVRRYGVGLFEALNGMRWGGQLRAGMPRFAMGGLVDNALRIPLGMPAFAGAGGGALPGKSFDLHIGGESFANLYAPEETAGRLVAFAAAQQARTAGRKPSWHRG